MPAGHGTMDGVIGRILANAIALGVATWLVPGINLGEADIANKVVTIILVAVIFGVVNAIVKPIFQIVASPVILLTLGLFLVVINTVLLLLTSWVATQFGLAWHVDGFGSALVGSLVVSIVSFIANAAFRKKKER